MPRERATSTKLKPAEVVELILIDNSPDS